MFGYMRQTARYCASLKMRRNSERPFRASLISIADPQEARSARVSCYYCPFVLLAQTATVGSYMTTFPSFWTVMVEFTFPLVLDAQIALL